MKAVEDMPITFRKASALFHWLSRCCGAHCSSHSSRSATGLSTSFFCKKTVDKTGISVYTVYIASFFFSLTLDRLPVRYIDFNIPAWYGCTVSTARRKWATIGFNIILYLFCFVLCCALQKPTEKPSAFFVAEMFDSAVFCFYDLGIESENGGVKWTKDG